jgi:hypothetical protein
MLIAFGIWLTFIAWVIVAGYQWQASKDPETQHLELLIDLGDPYATVYAEKIWDRSLPRIRDENGTPWALI